MIERFKGKANLIRLCLMFVALIGVYLTVAWASYSPLDNGWTIASSVTTSTLNKTGAMGAWIIDFLFAAVGYVAFVVPFTLVCVPAYLLISSQNETVNCRQVIGWLASFVVLMIGLAGLASVLFSNTLAYLSGGFIGAIQGVIMGRQFGVFGTLFIAMILTAIGFYFCSGQVILQLSNRLYSWILEDKEEKQKKESEFQEGAEPENYSQPLPVIENEPSEIESEGEVSPELNFTDVSKFTRPKITGLRTVSELQENQNPSSIKVAFEPLNVPNDVKLPSVNVLNEPFTSSASSFNPEPLREAIPYSEPEHDLPTVRLTPISGDLQQNVQKNAPISPVVEYEKQRQSTIPQVSLSAMGSETAITDEKYDQLDSDDLRVEIPKVEIQPAFLKPSTKMELPEPVEPESTPENVSKSYGNHLVHPLLQTVKKLEKPTTPLPTLDLLEEKVQETKQITEQEILETSARIEQELANFGVKATVEDVLVGPVVTRYEIKPAAGVKASKITNLESDLARALIFKAIRITDVVPGKPFMGIETPNPERETVWLRDVLASEAFRSSKAILPMALGKNINGDPVVVDMAKMPHLLVAGQTGGGKSVGVNTMILSLLYKLTPTQLRFIMIDPKVVELSVYNDIPHLLTPVVTEMKKAENALRWAVDEMERRYLLVSSLGVRNIEGFNNKIDQAAEMAFPIPNPLWRPGDTMDLLPPPLEKLPYIVLIVDEFADLMMSAGKQVEDHIMRIAQKARAVGIHLILATQRPSTDVITGVIKANIPSRIAFTVASQIDSRTILDKGGAESLLGRGDMLYSGAGSPEIIRVHGAFMSDDDVGRVADNWRARGKPHYIDSIVEASDETESEGGERGMSADLDPLFDEITQYIIDSGVTSISGIQRRFSIGFNRAARIIDQLEDQGIISAPDTRGKREILAR